MSLRFAILLTIVVVGTSAAPKKRKGLDFIAECGKPAEIFFLLDSSSSIWSVDFDKQLKFVSDVIGSFEIGPDKVRVGVASFSYRYRQEIPLGVYHDKEYLQAAVVHIRQSLGGTYTYDALDGVRTQGLSPGLVRPNVARVAIVMTDGESYYPDKTAEAAKKLKDDGVVVFAVGIGDQVNKEELKSIASEPVENYMFEVGSYELLDEIKEKLAIGACEVKIKDEPDPAPQCGATNPADVVFLMDPAELGAADTKVVYEFIGGLLEDFNTKPGNMQVGLESRNCGAHNIHLGEYEDTAEMTKAVRNSELPGLPHMIKRLRTHSYSKENGGRIAARHMAVIFVDDKLYNPKDVLDEARRTKNDDVELFVVAVGDSVVDDELMTLCSSPVDRHLIRVPDYDSLKDCRPEFLKKFCHGL